MCGRSSLHDAPVNVLERFRLPPVVPGFRPRYNIAPTQEQLTLSVGREGSAELAYRRWGLIPSWAKDISVGSRMINARSESLADRPAFADSFRRRRCLVIADGYFEWTGTGKSKVPMYFHLAGNEAFAMAGLWDRWGDRERTIESCTVVTTDASSVASRFHPRMPVILSLDDAERWVDPHTPAGELGELMKPCEDLEFHEVSRLVNSPANDSPECIEISR